MLQETLKNKQPSRDTIILLVEDNPADQKLTIKALQRCKVQNDIRIVEDGQEAMDYLLGTGKYGNRLIYPFPDLILLDINMPRMNGKQVLAVVRQDEKLKQVPIVVLTTSNHDVDVIESYQLGVNAYMQKPVTMQEFFSTIQKFEDFWLTFSVLPKHSA